MSLSKLENAEQLMQKIDLLFPLTALPEIKTLTIHSKDCFDCEHIQDDFKAYRDSYFDTFEQKLFDLNELLIRINLYLSLLSPIGFYWVLPHYLRYMLTSVSDEEKWNRANRENLGVLFNLGGRTPWIDDDFLRFSLLNNEQIIFIINFLKWFRGIANEEFFDDLYNEYIDSAINFLQRLNKK